MKASRIVRRIDDLGRVVIPREIRRTTKGLLIKELNFNAQVFDFRIQSKNKILKRKTDSRVFHNDFSLFAEHRPGLSRAVLFSHHIFYTSPYETQFKGGSIWRRRCSMSWGCG